jgi:hypothetical protein
MSWPAIVLWALIVPIALSRGPATLYAVSVVGAFMSLQMLPGEGQTMNLLPQTVFAAALIAKIALAPGNVLRAAEAAIDPARLGLFTAFIVYSVVGAFVLPRLFAGMVEVIPVSGADLTGASLLMPRSGNITQTAYMLISYLTAVALAVIGWRRDVRQFYLQSLLWGGLAIIATGALDLAFYHAGLSSLLDPFRTASYTLLTDVEAGGAKRVVGFTPEASSYGGLCVGAASTILFLRPLFRQGAQRLLATATMLGLLVMGALSTSATAYVGCGVLGCAYLFDLARRFLDRQAIGRDVLGWEIGILAVAGLLGFAIAALAPDRIAPILDVFDKVIFEKSASYSFYQRSLWTRTGWEAFLDTGGLGAGLGSIRTSNWSVSILGSTGIFGGLLLFGFFLQKLLQRTSHLSREDAAFASALKLSLLPYLAMNQLGGTIPDIGIAAAMTLGLLSARPTERRASASQAAGGLASRSTPPPSIVGEPG